jgi:hypothetical protein
MSTRERSSELSKKKKLHGNVDDPGHRPAEPSAVAVKYEALRAAGFGQALPLEARSGLALLLRRGMWSWARVQASAPAAQQPSCSVSPTTTVASQYGAVIRILAAMAMNANDRRAA